MVGRQRGAAWSCRVGGAREAQLTEALDFKTMRQGSGSPLPSPYTAPATLHMPLPQRHSPRNCWYCCTCALMSASPGACCWPAATPLVMPSIFWMGLSLQEGRGVVAVRMRCWLGAGLGWGGPGLRPSPLSHLCFWEKGWPRMAMCCWSSMSRSSGELALMRRP